MPNPTIAGPFIAVKGEYLLITHPEPNPSFRTEWHYHIVEKDNPSNILASNTSAIPAGTRYAASIIDERYESATLYEVRVFNDIFVQLDSGDFRTTEGVIDSDNSNVTVLEVNDLLARIYGLAGGNMRYNHIRYDRNTGMPVETDVVLYTDSSITDILATYTIKKKVDKVGRVIGEVMYRTSGV